MHFSFFMCRFDADHLLTSTPVYTVPPASTCNTILIDRAPVDVNVCGSEKWDSRKMANRASHSGNCWTQTDAVTMISRSDEARW